MIVDAGLTGADGYAQRARTRDARQLPAPQGGPAPHGGRGQGFPQPEASSNLPGTSAFVVQLGTKAAGGMGAKGVLNHVAGFWAAAAVG